MLLQSLVEIGIFAVLIYFLYKKLYLFSALVLIMFLYFLHLAIFVNQFSRGLLGCSLLGRSFLVG
jgi:hypothetical protein